MRCLSAILLCLLIAAPTCAQRQKREPLTEAQMEKIAEAGIDPNARVALYTQFLNERADAIRALTNRKVSDARASRLNDMLQDFTALMDELGDNLDQFADRKADFRKSLQALSEATPRWQGILRALAGELAPVRVNAVHPGIVGDSPAWSDKDLGAVVSRTPIGRTVTMDEIVDATLFLLDNGGVNGVNLVVEGGTLLR